MSQFSGVEDASFAEAEVATKSPFMGSSPSAASISIVGAMISHSNDNESKAKEEGLDDLRAYWTIAEEEKGNRDLDRQKGMDDQGSRRAIQKTSELARSVRSFPLVQPRVHGQGTSFSSFLLRPFGKYGTEELIIFHV
jgi:hypothetical protein